MKYKIIHSVFMLLIATFLFAGCASSDSTTQETTTDTTIDSQPATAAETDVLPEDTVDTNISANNQLGSRMNLVALIRQNPNLSTLSELIRNADMVVALESPGTYTFFAPTNEAFAALPQGTLEVLKQPLNKFELTELLQSHILPNRVTAAEMKDKMALKTTQGEEIIVQQNGQQITVGGANVTATDVEASNGIIHVIDKVLIPPKK